MIDELSEPTLINRLSWNFYAWEYQGRGGRVWPSPVHPEPPFHPFRHLDMPEEPENSHRKSSFFKRIADAFGLVSTAEEPFGMKADDFESTWSTRSATELCTESELSVFSVSISPDKKISIEDSEQFLLSLGSIENPVCFEIIGTCESIFLHICCRESDKITVYQQLSAYFPDCVIEEHADSIQNVWGNTNEGVVVDFGLSQEFMRPLRIFNTLDPDPLIGVIGSLTELKPGEVGIFQVIFSPVRHNWADSILTSVHNDEGKPFFTDCPDMTGLASEKVSRKLYAAVVRVAGRGSSDYESSRIARGLMSSLNIFSNPKSNELYPLDNAEYNDDDHITDLLTRQSRRSGMILNSRELVSMVHLPSISVKIPKLIRQLRKTKAAPSITYGHSCVLGENRHRGVKTEVSVSLSQRLRHTHVIGATGTGKTTFILNLIVQDMKMGNGLAVLDPHGDLTDMIMERVPDHRLDDVVLIDPSDIEHPAGFNPLQAHSEIEKIAISSDFVEVFRRLSTSWGDQMTSVLGNAVLAFLESDRGGTLVDMRRFLIEKDFRREYLKSVHDPEVVYFWEKGFQMLVGRPQGPILTRLDTFLRPKTIRRMVSQKTGLNFREIMDGKKILLAKLSQGLIGTENAYLLGTLLVSKIHQTAMARQVQQAKERVHFFVYIDEFHNFLTKSMADLLSGARKYNLGLVLAHQDLRQLWERDKEIANSVISNPGTRVCFRVGDFDAGKLEDGFSGFDNLDLQNLGLGEAIARIDKAENDFNLNTFPDPEVDPDKAAERRNQIIENSRLKYSVTDKTEAAVPVMEEPSVPAVLKTEKDLDEIKREINDIMPDMPVLPDLHDKDLEGSGGSEHRYLQTLIKKLAENLGFRAVIEEQTPDGKGKVDIGLEISGRKIACEISLTSKHSQEIGNIRKCLDAGYDRVIVCAQEKKSLSALKKLANDTFNPAEQTQLSFLLPQELIFHLEQEAASSAGSDQKVKGWNVKVSYQIVSDDEKAAKREAINKVIIQAFQRLRNQ